MAKKIERLPFDVVRSGIIEKINEVIGAVNGVTKSKAAKDPEKEPDVALENLPKEELLKRIAALVPEDAMPALRRLNKAQLSEELSEEMAKK